MEIRFYYINGKVSSEVSWLTYNLTRLASGSCSESISICSILGANPAAWKSKKLQTGLVKEMGSYIFSLVNKMIDDK